ncbi:hypothetical protein FGG08_007093 [Glutinoglossum americanum]|uniref:Uncharacterized protein n=1 Tax=Glutinoglossum americanum TaxID=1670608 RepID=A0A9P8I010_9PEZI|nr:hypothetical protein FGG08_007093 [Glutinoglossum americanum]
MSPAAVDSSPTTHRQPSDSRNGVRKDASMLPNSPAKSSPETRAYPIHLPRRTSSITRGITDSTEPMNPMLLFYQRVRRQSSADSLPPHLTPGFHTQPIPASGEGLDKSFPIGSQVLRKLYEGTNANLKDWSQFGPRLQSPELVESQHNTPGWIASPESMKMPESAFWGSEGGGDIKVADNGDQLGLRSLSLESISNSTQPEMSKLREDLRRFCKQSMFHGRRFQVLDIDNIPPHITAELPFDLDGDPLIYNLPYAIAATDHGVPDPWEATVDPVQCLEEDDPMGLEVFKVFFGCIEFCIMLHGCLVLLMDDLDQALSQQRKYPHRFGGLDVFYAKYYIQYTSSIFTTESHPLDSRPPSIFSPDGSFLESVTTLGAAGPDLPFLNSSGDVGFLILMAQRNRGRPL